jgi:hypothetical protein
MNQDFGVSFNALVELVVCRLSVFDANLVADHERRLGLA